MLLKVEGFKGEILFFTLISVSFLKKKKVIRTLSHLANILWLTHTFALLCFELISHVINPGRCNFLLSYCVIYSYFELYPFVHTYIKLISNYIKLISSELLDFRSCDLHTFYLTPYVRILLIIWLLKIQNSLKIYMALFTVPELMVQPKYFLGRYMWHYLSLKNC